MKQALIITDVQEDFLGNSDYIVPLCQKYLKKYAEAYDLVILTHWKHQENNTANTLMLSHPHAKVIEKTTYSAINDEVRGLLENHEIQRVHLAGMDAEATIMATMYHLLDLGYEVQILERLLASYFTRGWEATTIMRHVLGDENVLRIGGDRVWL
jgi:nicotinamidase-related amidase